MPVAPCFNPTTGASGGAPPVIPPGLFQLSPTLIDLTDGTWTLLDPDNLVSGVTHAGGFNTVTWNALAAGSNNYNWTSGSNHRGPRWYKLMTISGSQVTSVNHLVLTTRIQVDHSVSDFNQGMVVGAAIDPTSTVASTIDGTGGMFSKPATGNPAYGTWQMNTATSATSANNVYGVATVMRGQNALGSGVFLNTNASNVIQGSGSRNSNQNQAVAGTQNVFVMVGVGTRGNSDTVSAGDKQKFKMSFNAITVDVS